MYNSQAGGGTPQRAFGFGVNLDNTHDTNGVPQAGASRGGDNRALDGSYTGSDSSGSGEGKEPINPLILLGLAFLLLRKK